MNLKATLSALLMAGLAAPSAFASDGTITFEGEITNVTCSISGEGGVGPNFTVNLDGVDASKFGGVGTRVGETGFRIYIGKVGETTCTDTTKVWASFDQSACARVFRRHACDLLFGRAQKAGYLEKSSRNGRSCRSS